MINDDTNAAPDLMIPTRKRAQSRTFENFLWLLTKLEIDVGEQRRGVKYEHITLPPDLNFGRREGTIVKPPRPTRRRLFSINHEMIWDGLARMDVLKRQGVRGRP